MNLNRFSLQPLFLAIALLTRIPVSHFLSEVWQEKHQGLSVLWYPFVGLLLALLLYGAYCLLPGTHSSFLSAGIILVLWVALTGALHLDGFADVIDGLFAIHKVGDPVLKKQKILMVFKEPTVGPMAVVGLCLLLIMKLALLIELEQHLLLALVLSLALSRSMALTLIATTNYARDAGLGVVLHQQVPKWAVFWVLLSVIVSVGIMVHWFTMLLLSFGLVAFFLYWRQFFIKLIQGFVGDVVGALIELSELLVLFILYLCFQG